MLRATVRRLTWAAASACVGACVMAGAAHAQSAYPNKPIRIVVPTTPGGASDLMTRQLAQKMGESMGVAFVIDNKPGAGNTIGTDFVAKSPPDGYTLLMTYTDHTFNPFMYTSLPFDTVHDFTPVGYVGSVPQVLVVNPAVTASNVQELIAYARANPARLNFGSAGPGSSLHLAGELFKSMAKVDVVHVPYKGTGPAQVALISDEVQFSFPTLYSITQSIQNGRVRALAVATPKRLPKWPDLPTVAESGLPGYEASIWYGVLAPAGTPKPIIARLNAELNKAIASPEVAAKLGEQGFTLAPGTPEEFDERIKADLARWGKVIRDANFKLN